MAVCNALSCQSIDNEYNAGIFSIWFAMVWYATTTAAKESNIGPQTYCIRELDTDDVIEFVNAGFNEEFNDVFPYCIKLLLLLALLLLL